MPVLLAYACLERAAELYLYFMGFWFETLSLVETISLSSRCKAFFIGANNFVNTLELIVVFAVPGGEVYEYILMGC